MPGFMPGIHGFFRPAPIATAGGLTRETAKTTADQTAPATSIAMKDINLDTAPRVTEHRAFLAAQVANPLQSSIPAALPVEELRMPLSADGECRIQSHAIKFVTLASDIRKRHRGKSDANVSRDTGLSV
jgi:hypothetical protein